MITAGNVTSVYDGTNQPVAWERSRYHPALVFVVDRGRAPRRNCSVCALRIGSEIPGCDMHPCEGGVWLTEIEAAIIRLET